MELSQSRSVCDLMSSVNSVSDTESVISGFVQNKRGVHKDESLSWPTSTYGDEEGYKTNDSVSNTRPRTEGTES